MIKDTMINLVIVISGNHGRVSSILEYIAKSFNSFLKKDYRILSDYSLGRGEANPELLKKSSSISFKTKKSLADQEYYASPNCFAFDSLISSLYDSLFDGNNTISHITPNCFSDFSPDLLISKIQKIENGKDATCYCNNWEELNWCDFLVQYHFEKDHISNSIVTVRCLKNRGNIDYGSVIKYFKSILKTLDELYGDVFMSGYISNSNHSNPIVHTGLYKSNYYSNVFEFCPRYILGTEWGIYANNQIELNKLLSYDNNYHVNKLNNGIFVHFDCEINDFSNYSRKKMLNDFYDKVLPAYGEYRWSSLDFIEYSGYTIEKAYVFSEQPLTCGKMILFNNRLISADPTIVFSFRVEKDTFYENNSALSDKGLIIEL